MTNNHTKRSNHPKFFIKIKNMLKKKKNTSNKNINYHAQDLKKRKEKKEATGNVIAKKKLK